MFIGLNILSRKVASAVKQSPKDDYYNDNIKLPVYSRSSTRFDTQEIVNVLLDPELNDGKICQMQPTNVKHNAAFIVDISKLGCVKDLYCDDMG